MTFKYVVHYYLVRKSYHALCDLYLLIAPGQEI